MLERHNDSPTSINGGDYSGGHSWGYYDFAVFPQETASMGCGNKMLLILRWLETFEDILMERLEYWTGCRFNKGYGQQDELWANKDPRFCHVIHKMQLEGAMVDYHKRKTTACLMEQYRMMVHTKFTGFRNSICR